MRRPEICLFICLLIAGCSTKEPQDGSPNLPDEVKDLSNLTTYDLPARPDTVIFQKTKSYGVNENVVVGRILGAVVDNRERVYIADLDQKCIHVFGPDGRFITNLGRAGRGPGEFEWIHKMIIYDKRLYALDHQLKRINVFSLDSFSFLYSIKYRTDNWRYIKPLESHSPGEFYIQGDGSFLQEFVPTLKLNKAEYEKSHSNGKFGKNYFYRMNKKGEIIAGKIFEQQAKHWVFMDFHGRTPVGELPFYEKSLFAISKTGFFFSARSREFLIEEYDSVGNYLRAFYYPYENRVLHRDEVIKRYNSGPLTPYSKYLQQNELPKTWPALHSMRFDDENRLWISTIIDNKDVYQWWILNSSGKLLGRFTWPRDESIEDIKDGYLFTEKYVDKEGLQKVFKYKINIRKSQ